MTTKTPAQGPRFLLNVCGDRLRGVLAAQSVVTTRVGGLWFPDSRRLTAARPSQRGPANAAAWIGQARRHQETRRSLSAQLIHRRGSRRDPLCQGPRHPASTLADGVASAEADQGRRHRARQQDRQNGLGHDGQGRALQRTRRACGVNEVSLGIWRDVKVGRANST